MHEKPVIAITMGDPGGVGPEIVLKAINSNVVSSHCQPLIIGDMGVMSEARHCLPITMHYPLKAVADPDEDTGHAAKVLDMANVAPGELTVGRAGAYAGRAAVGYITKAVELAKAGRVAAVVTAPINKETLKMAGYTFPGHTELLAELTNTSGFGMMLVGGGLRVILVTIHTALANVPGMITREKVLATIRLARRACGELGIKAPKIAVAGLNPHAGEGGLFGDEEGRHIIPACEDARAEGMDVTGPVPPDTLFFKAKRGDYDIVVAMYHDQGLIPLKMLAFGSAVNVTVGLPIIRTSVDHGTAYDIAGKGIANPDSLIQAVKLAAEMAGRRHRG
ncbi:MAG: 4-hydroxythreonine-4-phosphate dehydrogenase PdxA [Nitrospirae bacterium]|nr:4-hydroxythreonine-4-phosphate dehydrogenase PdxA [Nitrospirota bacterium]